MLAVEARNSAIKQQRLDRESQEDDTEANCMALTGLHMHDSAHAQEGSKVQGNVNVLQDKVKEFDKAV
eukprot:5968946-Ditylum_brightwellii.AAC.1